MDKNTNFCPHCGKKQNQTCAPCWVLKKDFACGNAECPGYGLFIHGFNPDALRKASEATSTNI